MLYAEHENCKIKKLIIGFQKSNEYKKILFDNFIFTQMKRFSLTIKKLYSFHLTYSMKTDNF